MGMYRRRGRTKKQKALLKVMQGEVAKKSADLGIAAELIAPEKRTVERDAR